MSTTGQQQPSGQGQPKPRWVRLTKARIFGGPDNRIREVVRWTDGERNPVIESDGRSYVLLPGEWEAAEPVGPTISGQEAEVKWLDDLQEPDDSSNSPAPGSGVAGSVAKGALWDAIEAYCAASRDTTDGAAGRKAKAAVLVVMRINKAWAEGRTVQIEKLISEFDRVHETWTRDSSGGRKVLVERYAEAALRILSRGAPTADQKAVEEVETAKDEFLVAARRLATARESIPAIIKADREFVAAHNRLCHIERRTGLTATKGVES